MTEAGTRNQNSETPESLASEHFSYGHVYLDQNDSERAREEFALAVELRPDDGGALVGLGRSLLGCGRAADALPVLEKAATLNPGYADAHFHLAQALAELEERDRAIDHYKEALNINPRYGAANAALSRLLHGRGRAAHEQDHAHIEQEKTSRQANTHFHLGAALLQKKLSLEALAELKQAIALRPGYPDFHNKLGELYASRGHYHLAEEEFRLALKLHPRYLAAQVNLAHTLQRHADRLASQSEAAYRRALELDPGNPMASAALDPARPQPESPDSAL